MDQLLATGLAAALAAGIRVLRERDGVELSGAQIRERASNLTMAILGNYDVRRFADDDSCVVTALPAIGAHV